MPTYEYQCPAGHSFEKFQKMTDKPRAKCPTCGQPASRRISGGAGLLFKGSGFYITDYGKDGKGRRTPTGEGAPPAESGGKNAGSGSSAKAEPAAPAPAKPAKGAE